MANHSYLRVWTRDFSLETMLAEFARFLTTAPLSATQNSFSELTVQAVDATEIPVAEWDLRPLKVGPAEVVALAVQHLNADTAYIANAKWDLWRRRDTLWPTWASSIFLPGMEGCWRQERRRIRSIRQIILLSIPFGNGCRQAAT